MERSKWRCIIACLLSAILILTFIVQPDLAIADTPKVENEGNESLLNRIPQIESAIKYSEYQEKYQSVSSGKEEIVLKGSDYSKLESMEVSVNGDEVTTGRDGKIFWDFDLEEEGLYQIKIEYYPVDNGGSGIEMKTYVNGEMPFEESRVVFYRVYKDKSKDYREVEGNQAFPSQVEAPEWSSVYLEDPEGHISEPLKFYFKKGKNQFGLKAIKDQIKIKQITLTPIVERKTYEEYLKEHQNNGVKIVENSDIKIQAEDATAKSSPSFYPINDRTSAATEPYHPTYIILNTIGGKGWGNVGDWLRWEVEVPEDGLYQIALRYKQNELRGLFAVRSILINGEIPFQEATDLRFSYKSSFQVDTLSSLEDEPYYFYLKKGSNTITLKNSLGAYADLIYRVEDVSDRLNAVYQDIVVITGTSPDVYQDYQLEKRLPNMLSQFEEAKNLLAEIQDDMVALCGGTNDKTSVLGKNVLLLERILKKPSSIPKNVKAIRDSITAMGQWVLDVTNQPLTLDYLLVTGSSDKLPKAEGDFFQQVKHEFLGFVGSFTNDYNVYKTDESLKEQKEIEVWVTTGRDQMDVVRQLVNESFTSKTGIPVKLKLVSPSVLLTATSVGRGPDVVIQVSSTVPVDFAVRDAAYDLTKFSDFEEVASQFHKATIDGFEYADKYYGLPDQMSFPVLFYRSDILNQYNIPVPETWEDVISIIPYLQANNMEFYLDRESVLTLGTAVGVGSNKAINTVYLSMLYQLGGELYNEKGTESLLNSTESLKAFTTWTDFYRKHSFSVTMDFVTRFRLGEVPLAIMDFTNYNKLSVSAPEIAGKWSVALMPGTEQADGSIDHSLPVTTSASVMIRNTVEKHKSQNESWEFMKWWTSSEIQTSYAREMESILGSSGRYPVANLESFHKVPWQTDILNVLTDSLVFLREVRQIPGSYITGRYLENAFYEIINTKTADEIDVLFEYNDKVSEEIKNKLKEFGLETE